MSWKFKLVFKVLVFSVILVTIGCISNLDRASLNQSNTVVPKEVDTYNVMLRSAEESIKAENSFFGLPLVRFGLLGDTHYSHKTPYRSSMVKRAIQQFNEANVDFVVFTGDMIDGDDNEQDVINDYKVFQEDIAFLKAPRKYLIGNHDHVNGYSTKNDLVWWRKVTGQDETYYSWEQNGMIFTAIMSDVHNHLDNQQEEWLKSIVKNRTKPMIILSPDTLTNVPDGSGNFSVPCPDSKKIMGIIDKSTSAIVGGGFHLGGFVVRDSTVHYAIKMDSLAIVSVYPDSIMVYESNFSTGIPPNSRTYTSMSIHR